MKTFDLIVLGGGSGGLSLASFMNRVGLAALLVDRSAEHIGGDCLNYGCVPSKALIHAAREVAAARRGGNFGLSVSGEADLARVRAYVKEKQAVFRKHENPDYLRSKGIAIALGDAVFTGKDTVRVGEETYRGKYIVIATGSRPRPYALPGAEGILIHSNETIFDLGTLPKKLVCIGGGPISLEIGQAFHLLGSQVSVVDVGSEILGKEDPLVAARLRETLSKDGIAFHLRATPNRIEGGTALIVAEGGAERALPFDALFASVGRIPNTESLNLAAAGIAVENGRIVSDASLRTTNRRVFVAGDASGSYQFTHAAELHAGIILNNFFSPFRKKVPEDALSWVTYTSPELATFGASEAELKKRCIAYSVLAESFEDDDRAIIDGYRDAFVRLFLSPRGLLLGGTMLAPAAGELIQEFTLIMQHRIPLTKLGEKVYPYPIASRVNRRLALLESARRLTPRATKLLRFLFRIV